MSNELTDNLGIEIIMNNKKIIDWNLGATLAGNKQETASEMLTFLVKILPQELSDLSLLLNTQNYTELAKRLHKLHGGLCYCGTPHLKDATAVFESALKQKQYDTLTSLFDQLSDEANSVIDLFNNHHRNIDD